MTTGDRGVTGVMMKVFGADDYELTVTDRQEITAHYLRLSFTGGGMLGAHTFHPTMSVRLWFPTVGTKVHQRAYTVIRPNPAADTFDIEFALHDGPAANWARAARPGDTLAASVLRSSFDIPEPTPTGYLIVGDTASLPAINSLLGVIGAVPARIWLEWVHETDRTLPVLRDGHELTWVQRRNDGADLTASIARAATPLPGHFGFVACDTKTTRAVTAVLRKDYRIARKAIKSQGYWMP